RDIFHKNEKMDNGTVIKIEIATIYKIHIPNIHIVITQQWLCECAQIAKLRLKYLEYYLTGHSNDHENWYGYGFFMVGYENLTTHKQKFEIYMQWIPKYYFMNNPIWNHYSFIYHQN